MDNGRSSLKSRLIASALNKYRPSTGSGTTLRHAQGPPLLFHHYAAPARIRSCGFRRKTYIHIFRPFRAFGSTALVS